MINNFSEYFKINKNDISPKSSDLSKTKKKIKKNNLLTSPLISPKSI